MIDSVLNTPLGKQYRKDNKKQENKVIFIVLLSKNEKSNLEYG